MGRGLASILLLVASSAIGPAAGQAIVPRTADLGDGVAARLDGTRVVISAVARDGEDWDALAGRVLSDPARGPALEAASAPTRLAPGIIVPIPLALWPAGLGRRALLGLFPGDSVDEERWRHPVTAGATPWSLAVLFTGSGRNNVNLRNAQGAPLTCKVGEVLVVETSMLRPELRPGGIAASAAPPPAPVAGTTIRGNGSTLELVLAAARDALREAEATQAASLPAEVPTESPTELHADGLPATGDEPAIITEPQSGMEALETDGGETYLETESGIDEAPVETSTLLEECAPVDDGGATAATERDAFVPKKGSRSEDGSLAYDVDLQGPHAVYRLKAGETLYSHVVLRFTGLLSGREVNAAALRLAKRSAIADVTDIAVGTAVRIPLDDLLPQFLPEDHPRRLAWELEQSESQRLATRERRRNLEGVHVLVDSGHGGLDPGAGNGVAWEDDHVYDIACRVMAVLVDRTNATVHPFVRDRSSGHAPLGKLRRDTDEVLLTTPPTALDSVPTRVAVNLRWLMSNGMRRSLAASGVSDDRVVFVSIHADSLHPSATGAMAYFPAATLRTETCGVPSEAPYRAVQESDGRNAFSMSRRECLRSEGLSRNLGECIIGSVRAAGLGVHGYGPVRGSIQRGGLMVPAVLKYNRVPASVLIEACNLNNPEDRLALRDPVYRQRLAEAIVAGLVRYFDDQPARRAPSREAARR